MTDPSASLQVGEHYTATGDATNPNIMNRDGDSGNSNSNSVAMNNNTPLPSSSATAAAAAAAVMSGAFGRRVTIGGMNTAASGLHHHQQQQQQQHSVGNMNMNMNVNMDGSLNNSSNRRSSLGFDSVLNELFHRRNSEMTISNNNNNTINNTINHNHNDPLLGGYMSAVRRPSGFNDFDLFSGRRDSFLGGPINSITNNNDPHGLAVMAAARRNSLLAMQPQQHQQHHYQHSQLYPHQQQQQHPHPQQPSYQFPHQPDRRNSLESTTVALDAAIMDLTRRKLSMAYASPLPPSDMAAFPAPFASYSQQQQQQQQTVHSITAQHHQVHELQRELDRRKKQLEMEHQQILRGIEKGKMAMSQLQHSLAAAGTTTTTLPPPSSSNMNQQQFNNARNHALLMGNNNNNKTPMINQQQHSWVVCQFCNVKAFPTQDEAFAHEAVCGATALIATATTNNNNNNGPFNAESELTAYTNAPSATTTTDTKNSTTKPTPKRRLSLNLSGNQEETRELSTGPFCNMSNPLPLSMESDRDWLTPLHCFVRRHCVQVFTASEQNVAAPSKGKRKPIQVGQVGIRCPHCHTNDVACERGSVYYPTSISSIYNATMNLLQRHLHSCSAVPPEIMARYETLKADDARSGTSKRYWVESALCLGLVDTVNGIRYSSLPPPPLPSLSKQQQSEDNFCAARRNSNDFFSSDSNAAAANNSNNNGNSLLAQNNSTDNNNNNNSTKAAPLITPDDEPYATAFSYRLISQMQPCKFTEADRLGKRKGLPPGFPGLACRHCFGGYGSGRFFPSSIKTLSDTSKTLNVLHNHMMRCRKCPQEVRDKLEALRVSHDEERAKMKFGSQKAFFARIWDRLHGSAPTLKRKIHTPTVDPRALALTPNMLDMLAMHQMQEAAAKRHRF